MGKFDELPEIRRKGLEKMEKVYGFEILNINNGAAFTCTKGEPARVCAGKPDGTNVPSAATVEMSRPIGCAS